VETFRGCSWEGRKNLKKYLDWLRRYKTPRNLTTLVSFDSGKDVGKKKNKAATSQVSRRHCSYRQAQPTTTTTTNDNDNDNSNNNNNHKHDKHHKHKPPLQPSPTTTTTNNNNRLTGIKIKLLVYFPI
jgi:hypothetical protein